MHGLHPNGHLFRVIKHVAQYTVDSVTVWVTHHEPWHRSAAYPFVMPLRLPALQPEAIRAFAGDISVAHVQHVGPLLRETPSLDVLLARLRVVDAEAHTAPELHRTVRAALATLPTLGRCLRQARDAQHLSLQAVAQRCTARLGHPVTHPLGWRYLVRAKHRLQVPRPRHALATAEQQAACKKDPSPPKGGRHRLPAGAGRAVGNGGDR